jgi:hypothetical protein
MLKTNSHSLRFRLAALSLLIALLGFLSMSPAGGLTTAHADEVNCLQQYNQCRDMYCYGSDCKLCSDQLRECNLGLTQRKVGKVY